MPFGFVATHYPHPAHHDDFIARARRAADVMRPTPGCLAADCWVTPSGDAVVTIAQWESLTAQAASLALATAAGVDFAFDEREVRPREVIRLVSPPTLV